MGTPKDARVIADIKNKGSKRWFEPLQCVSQTIRYALNTAVRVLERF